MVSSAKDTAYLGMIRDYYAKWRVIPSYNKLCDVLGMASRSAVGKVLTRLASEGYLSRTPDGDWSPTREFFGRSLADFHIPAGSPASATDTGVGEFLLDEYLIDDPSQTTLVPVRGDSMNGAGIFDGDMVAVRRTTEATRGEIVAAVVDGELTLKELDIEEGHYVLRPANPDYQTIRPRGSLELFGVVVGLVRKYRK
jgi:repressor LexA